jgi:hypothetical protein
MFIFVARGVVDSVWTFPPLDGFAMAFLLSLSTLIAAQTTSRVVGMKGAGQVGPSVSDLVVHGGVLALERVQQLLWTVIAIGMFLVVVYKSYASATTLPTVPNELLVLMGISSGGYLAGKAARSAGPIIDRVLANSGSVILSIEGKQLSTDAQIWLDGAQLDDEPTVLAVEGTDRKVARTLELKLARDFATWNTQEHKLMVMNPDGQRAEWMSTPEVANAKLIRGPIDADTLVVNGRYFGNDALWQLTGALQRSGTASQSGDDGRKWSVPVTIMNRERQNLTGQLTIVTARGQRVTVGWSEASAPSKDESTSSNS